MSLSASGSTFASESVTMFATAFGSVFGSPSATDWVTVFDLMSVSGFVSVID